MLFFMNIILVFKIKKALDNIENKKIYLQQPQEKIIRIALTAEWEQLYGCNLHFF